MAEKDTKAFIFTLRDGTTIQKYGKNIDVYKDGILMIEEDIFIPMNEIVHIEEYEADNPSLTSTTFQSPDQSTPKPNPAKEPVD